MDPYIKHIADGIYKTAQLLNISESNPLTHAQIVQILGTNDSEGVWEAIRYLRTEGKFVLSSRPGIETRVIGVK
jgi:hypothetical protein